MAEIPLEMPLPVASEAVDLPFAAIPTIVFDATGNMLVFDNENEPGERALHWECLQNAQTRCKRGV